MADEVVACTESALAGRAAIGQSVCVSLVGITLFAEFSLQFGVFLCRILRVPLPAWSAGAMLFGLGMRFPMSQVYVERL